MIENIKTVTELEESLSRPSAADADCMRLLAGRWCLDPAEDLSPGQLAEIDRVTGSYPQLTDDDFVRSHLDRWLK